MWTQPETFGEQAETCTAPVSCQASQGVAKYRAVNDAVVYQYPYPCLDCWDLGD